MDNDPRGADDRPSDDYIEVDLAEYRPIFEPLARWQRIVIFLSLGITCLVADQFTKELVIAEVPEGRQTVTVIDGYLWLSHVYNPGIAWGMLSDHPELVSGIAIVTITIVLIAGLFGRFGWPVYLTGLGLVVGGALGNLFDRLLRPRGVVDFIDVGWWPQFNVADAAVVVGAILVGYAIIRASRIEEKLIQRMVEEVEAAEEREAAHADSKQGDE
jgi:signal peptidase II